ncbi:hypothetical protein CONLIGDRAFT_548742, partial [Coniochaeta ligniaria NRRL 30616]
QYGTMEPAILGTCRQIYQEATPVLYSGNVFVVNAPEQMFRLMAQIGPANTKLVKSLELWVPLTADLTAWLRLLDALSKEATGLKSIKIGWGADTKFPWMLQKGAKERGLGDNVLFVRAFAKIRGLEKIHLNGLYAKRWPSYLEEATGAHVRADRGPHLELGAFQYLEVTERAEFVRELKQDLLRDFEKYQKGTEDIIP